MAEKTDNSWYYKKEPTIKDFNEKYKINPSANTYNIPAAEGWCKPKKDVPVITSWGRDMPSGIKTGLAGLTLSGSKCKKASTLDGFNKNKDYTFTRKAVVTVYKPAKYFNIPASGVDHKNKTFVFCSELNRWILYNTDNLKEATIDNADLTEAGNSKDNDDGNIDITGLSRTNPDTLPGVSKLRSNTLKGFLDNIDKIRDDVSDSEEGGGTKGGYIPDRGKELDGKLNIDKDIAHAIRARGIAYENRNDWYKAYNRMQWANPYYSLGPTREYLFFTKPDLHILGKSTQNGFENPDKKLNPELGSDPFWDEMYHRYRRNISCLQYTAARKTGYKDLYKEMDKGEFIRPLTNAVSGTLDLPDVSSETVDTPQNIYGTSLQYKKSGQKSDEGFDFSLEFIDNQWLDIYHMFKIWNEYSNLKDLGIVTPPGPINRNPYRINKILHDQIGIFKFIVGEDGETLIYWAYLTGCFPKSLPRSVFGNLNPGMIQYSVDWHGQFVDDMHPLILMHFNSLIRKQVGMETYGNGLGTGTYKAQLNEKGLWDAGYKYIPIYSQTYQEINGGWRSVPVIAKVKDTSLSTQYRYLLQWYDKR